MPDLILRNGALDKKLLDYILATSGQSSSWWDETVPGRTASHREQFKEYRLRYDGRRSVASLYEDVKTSPFPRSSNLGVPAEAIFGEFLIPTTLANTHDLEPMLQAVDEATDKPDEALTSFHDAYHRNVLSHKRQQLEESTREVYTVGGVIHKWTWGSVWKQSETERSVWVHPISGLPALAGDPSTGELQPMPADPSMPEELYPTDPETGMRLKISKVSSVSFAMAKEGPTLSVRPLEAIEFPPGATSADPDDWDWIADNFTVSPWWFLGREGDPFEGKLQNVEKLWKWLGVNPNEIYRRPDGKLTQPVKLKEWHGKFPMTASGTPVEIIALVATDAKLLLAWRVSRFPRRPFFNRQVWSRAQHPLGKGIPETTWGLRNAIDASLNQDTDAGNLYNHPPLLLSSLAMLEDEDYETVGPGTQWVMTNINGAKFLPMPTTQRDPIARENWILSMLQRMWGVTDLNLNAPTSTLSPNIQTAHGVVAVLSQGNIKFGHLTKRLAETDSREYQFVHDLFRTMMVNPRKVSVNGKPIVIQPQEREQFFRPDVRVTAVGNGITTNPQLRQQVSQQLYTLYANEPFVGGDLEVRKQLVEFVNSAYGWKVDLKDPQALQQATLMLDLMATEPGQRLIPQAMQQAIQELQQTQATAGNGRMANVSMVPTQSGP